MVFAVSRRQFIASATAASLASQTSSLWSQETKTPPFKISLAQWSLNKPLFGKKLDNLDFAKYTKEKFGIEAVEYVNQFFKDKAQDADYIAELAKRAADEGVTNVLIMCDGLGNLGGKFTDAWGMHGYENSLELCLPPLSVLVFRHDPARLQEVEQEPKLIDL